MKKILYIHGWLSAGISTTSNFLQRAFPNCAFITPDVPADPTEAITMLRALVTNEKPDLIIGTSLGGFYANLLRGTNKILVNPAFEIPTKVIYPGGHIFHNKRANNETDVMFTEEQMTELYRLQSTQFNNMSWEDRKSTHVLIGTQDDIVNCSRQCEKEFPGNVHYALFGHRLTPDIITSDLVPIINSAFQIAENIQNFQSVGPNDLK
jgi:uncharacterized protein